MPNATTLDDQALAQMDHRPREVVGLARSGDVAAAQALLSELIRHGHLSGQDLQNCEDQIARARNG